VFGTGSLTRSGAAPRPQNWCRHASIPARTRHSQSGRTIHRTARQVVVRARPNARHQAPRPQTDRAVSDRKRLTRERRTLTWFQRPCPGAGELPSPSFADLPATSLQGRKLPSPRPRARFRSAARPAFRATSTTGSPQGGNQR
jgi:hypothetical protein